MRPVSGYLLKSGCAVVYLWLVIKSFDNSFKGSLLLVELLLPQRPYFWCSCYNWNSVVDKIYDSYKILHMFSYL